MMAFILLRMVAELLLSLGGGAACLILIGIGDKQGALNVAVVCGILIWFVRPNAEDRADFAAFQKSRERFPPAA